AALKNRRDRVRSARFYWTEHRVEAKGWVKYPGQSKDVNPKGLTIPEEDLAYELESSLLLDQNKWRYDLHNRTWRPESKKQGVSFDETRCFDGKVYKTLLGPRDTRTFPQGFLGKDNSRPQQIEAYLMPLLWAFRLPDDTLAQLINLKEMRISPQ